MMWYWGSGGGWGMWIFWILIMLMLWGGLAAILVILFRSLVGSRHAHPDRAMDTLRRRLGTGEINQEEFERISKVIQG